MREPPPFETSWWGTALFTVLLLAFIFFVPLILGISWPWL